MATALPVVLAVRDSEQGRFDATVPDFGETAGFGDEVGRGQIAFHGGPALRGEPALTTNRARSPAPFPNQAHEGLAAQVVRLPELLHEPDGRAHRPGVGREVPGRLDPGAFAALPAPRPRGHTVGGSGPARALPQRLLDGPVVPGSRRRSRQVGILTGGHPRRRPPLPDR